MANKVLIVHGYSDGRTSFTGLGEFLIERGVYTRDNVFYLNYSSMDDEATFHDFADKLDADWTARFSGERLDVICHSTGSLVVRAWLALHSARAARRGERDTVTCPVDRLVCLAPANFGSDLARLGQSFLGRFRATFFNKNTHEGDAGESGKVVLQGLEPASPFQWLLSFEYDLHSPLSYFRTSKKADQVCYPFVLAAGEAYTGIEAKLVEARGRIGTDGTVRIAGTSLNTRACTLDFRPDGAAITWWQEYKFERIPFAVFSGVNHGSIVDGTRSDYGEPNRPGAMIEAVLRPRTTTPDDYQALADEFDRVSEWNYARLPQERQTRFQQFFFRVQDDVDHLLDDYHIDFYVEGPDGEPHEELTLQFDQDFESQITTHSTTRSFRVYMMNCSNLARFHEQLKQHQARLVLEVTGVSTLPDVRYVTSRFVAYDPATAGTGPSLLVPNTTTLINVALNRMQTNRLLSIDPPLASVTVSEKEQLPLTGRAKLIEKAAARMGGAPA